MKEISFLIIFSVPFFSVFPSNFLGLRNDPLHFRMLWRTHCRVFFFFREKEKKSTGRVWNLDEFHRPGVKKKWGVCNEGTFTRLNRLVFSSESGTLYRGNFSFIGKCNNRDGNIYRFFLFVFYIFFSFRWYELWKKKLPINTQLRMKRFLSF